MAETITIRVRSSGSGGVIVFARRCRVLFRDGGDRTELAEASRMLLA